MHANGRWPRFNEPVRETLSRNVTLATMTGVVAALLRRDPRLFLPISCLALWPTLGGHYVEVAFLNGLRPRVSDKRPAQAAVRLVVWCGGGVLVYLCMSATARALPIRPLPLGTWWYGSFLFVGVELVAHAVLGLRGRPNFYDGRG
jgi:hypothetical protein